MTDVDPIRVLLADEQALFREAVRVVLEDEEDIAVVAVVRDGLQAVAEAERTLPDVALLDAGLPNCDGIRATALLRERVSRTRVIVVAPTGDSTSSSPRSRRAPAASSPSSRPSRN